MKSEEMLKHAIRWHGTYSYVNSTEHNHDHGLLWDALANHTNEVKELRKELAALRERVEAAEPYDRAGEMGPR